mgnify:CR=1 FL=1
MPADRPAADPWFRDGLHFTCTQCGKCCTGAPGFVWVDDAEAKAIAARLGEPLREFLAVYTREARGKRTLREKANGDCVFWEAGRGCTVYPVRPKQCRTWPFWESNLESPEAWERTVDDCPGSGEGQFFPVDEILKRMREIKI